MKCFCCGKDIPDGDKFFNASNMSLWNRRKAKGVEKFTRVNVICLDCIEESSDYYDEYGTEIDIKYERSL